MKRHPFMAMIVALFIIGLIVSAIDTWSIDENVRKFRAIIDAKSPLTMADVKALVGEPQRIETSESTGVTGATYCYFYNNGVLKVIFVNGVLFRTVRVASA